MALPPPIEQYLTGSKPSHSRLKDLPQYFPHLTREELGKELVKRHYISKNKITKQAVEDGAVEPCDGIGIWNIKRTKELLAPEPTVIKESPFKTEPEKPLFMDEMGEEWVDLLTIGTYFGASNIRIGKWLTELGLYEKEEIKKTESGNIDALDVANMEKKKRSQFVGKIPTKKALEAGIAKRILVPAKGKKTIEITKWNLKLTKEVLIRAGHPLDHERKMLLKGKGKNSDVEKDSIDRKALDLFLEWEELYNNPKTKWKAKKVFKGQPRIILEKSEAYMDVPGYLTEGRYLRD